jgi:hypothetical protein
MMTVVIPVTCRGCGGQHEIAANFDGLLAWKNGELLIQDALPELSADERELLLSGTCGVCWDEWFGPENDDVDD